MGIEKIGVKIFSPVAEKFVQKFGARSILQTKQPIFHGINPTLTYAPSGKTFTLPRFCTQEMKQARQMNKIAIHQAKAGDVVKTYPKATAQDLKRLTSQTIEDSYSRVEWTNPKDGKVYNLLKQGETEDGKVIVRILENEGAFIKDAELTPKKIIMIDHFGLPETSFNCLSREQQLSHGDQVRIYAMRNNPFAKYTFVNIGSFNRGKSIVPEFTSQLHPNELRGNYDYVSLSCGEDIPITQQYMLPETREIRKKTQELFTSIPSKNTRVLVAASNSGKEYKNVYLAGQVEGVGSLTSKGKISNFSSSRNSCYTQHYEQGEFKSHWIKDEQGQIIGENITGLSGCDVKFNFRKLSRSEFAKFEQLKKELQKIDDLYQKNRWEDDFEYINKLYKQKSDLECEIYTLTKGTVYRNYGLYGEPKTQNISGTSFSTPIRTAKLALNDMMEGII